MGIAGIASPAVAGFGTKIQIANPVTFLAQKGFSFTKSVSARIARKTSCTGTTRSKFPAHDSRRRQWFSSETSATTFAG
jgi:hypothetical protein